MSAEISSENRIVLEGIDIKDPETKRAFTLIGQWISYIDKKLDTYVQEKSEGIRDKKNGNQFWINFALTVIMIGETCVLILLGTKVI